MARWTSRFASLTRRLFRQASHFAGFWPVPRERCWFVLIPKLATYSRRQRWLKEAVGAEHVVDVKLPPEPTVVSGHSEP